MIVATYRCRLYAYHSTDILFVKSCVSHARSTIRYVNPTAHCCIQLLEETDFVVPLLIASCRRQRIETSSSEKVELAALLSKSECNFRSVRYIYMNERSRKINTLIKYIFNHWNIKVHKCKEESKTECLKRSC